MNTDNLDKIRKQIGKEIKAEIKKKDLSYYSIAKNTGIQAHVIHKIERGENVTLNSLLPVVAHLGLPFNVGNVKI